MRRSSYLCAAFGAWVLLAGLLLAGEAQAPPADPPVAPYDGVSEFWFDDREAFERAMASPETTATLADAANLLMPPQIFLVDERVRRCWRASPRPWTAG